MTLYFLREDDGLFVPETRTIAASGSIAREAEAVLDELIKGSRNGLPSALPTEAKVGQVFVTKDGTAYADFSKDFVDRPSLRLRGRKGHRLRHRQHPGRQLQVGQEGLHPGRRRGEGDPGRPHHPEPALPAPDFSLVAKD